MRFSKSIQMVVTGTLVLIALTNCSDESLDRKSGAQPANPASENSAARQENRGNVTVIEEPEEIEKADFYVAPDGSPSGDGSLEKPWDLQTAFSHPTAVLPGHVILALPGEYLGRFVSKLNGTNDKPIIVRSNRKSMARINGNSPLPENRVVEELLATGTATMQMTFSNPSAIAIGDGFRIGAEAFNVYGKAGTKFLVSRAWSGTVMEAHPANSLITISRGGKPTLDVKGSNTWIMGFDIMDSDPDRRTEITGSHPWDLNKGDVNVNGSRIKLINCIIRDNRQGISAQGGGAEAEFYGNIVYNNGWDAPDRGHGHSVYTQNATGTLKTYRSNFLLPSYGNVLQQYGSSAAKLDNFVWDKNVFIDGSVLFGGGSPVNDLTLSNNMTYAAGFKLGYSAYGNKNAKIHGNYMDGIGINYWDEITMTDNVLFASSLGGVSSGTISFYSEDPTNYNLASNTMNRNTIYSQNLFHTPTDRYIAFRFPGLRSDPMFALNEWRAMTGYESEGTVVENMRRPNVNKIFVMPNAYDKSIVHVIIYNWEKLDSVNVDLSEFFTGDSDYQAHQVMDYFNDISKGKLSNGKISMPMTGHTIAAPIGGAPLMRNTFPEFGAFILRGSKTHP